MRGERDRQDHVALRVSEEPDVDLVLRLAARKGVACTIGQTSFFTSKPTRCR